ncbi:MAG: tetratricopeptide repeat protein [Spirochaetales bacterium]|nr:tetratricopeptide repeat protein [Spirochaetales bacterium]
MKFLFFLALLLVLAPGMAQDQSESKENKESAFEKNKVEQGQKSLRYAGSLIAAGQVAQATRILEDLLILYPFHPDNATMLTLLGDLASGRGELERALSWYRRAYLEGRNKETGSKAYLKAGELAVEMGEVDQARSIFLDLARERKHEEIGRDAENRLKALSSS